jgi:hypothetical protein
MKVVYKVNGIIEINLDKETTQAYKLSCDKDGFLQEYFNNALNGCSVAGEIELDYNVNFKGLNIESIKK